MAMILVYEALFGRGIQCGGKHRLAIKRHKSSLNAALVRMKIKKGVVNNKDLLPDSVKDEGKISKLFQKAQQQKIRLVVPIDVYSFLISNRRDILPQPFLNNIL